MADDLEELVEDLLQKALRELRKGYGWRHDGDLEVFPGLVRRRLGVDDEDGPVVARRQLSQRLERAVAACTEETRDLIHMSLNLDDERIQWLTRAEDYAQQNGTSVKTVIRRVDNAFKQLAAALLGPVAEEEEPPADDLSARAAALQRLRQILNRSKRTQLLHLEANVFIYRDKVEVEEIRHFQAVTTGVEHYVIARALHWPDTEIDSSAYNGAALEEAERIHDNYVVELFQFPWPLDQGEKRTFTVRHATRRMAPVYILSSEVPPGKVTVRLQFVDAEPTKVYEVADAPPALFRTDNLSEVIEEHFDEVDVDRLGFCVRTFTPDGDNCNGLAWQSVES